MVETDDFFVPDEPVEVLLAIPERDPDGVTRPPDVYEAAAERLKNWDGSSYSVEEVAELSGVDLLGDDDGDES